MSEWCCYLMYELFVTVRVISNIIFIVIMCPQKCYIQDVIVNFKCYNMSLPALEYVMKILGKINIHMSLFLLSSLF